VYGHLPAPAIYDKTGKALLSWRVAILPFIEQQNLYKQFKLDEPWDGPHNKPLADIIVKAYSPPGGADLDARDRALTYYQAIVGQGAAWEPRKELRFPTDFLDGTSNTILVVEAATPVPWTKPEDLPFVPDQALPKFGGLFDGNFHALMADGSVQFFSAKADQEQLRYAITRAEGTPVDFNKLVIADGRGPGGKVDLNDLPRQNERLRAALESATREAAKERDQMELLKARIAAGTKVDEKTVKLLKENTELQKKLDKVLEELESLRAERQRLEQELRKKRP
jgi:hypothetical protein